MYTPHTAALVIIPSVPSDFTGTLFRATGTMEGPLLHTSTAVAVSDGGEGLRFVRAVLSAAFLPRRGR